MRQNSHINLIVKLATNISAALTGSKPVSQTPFGGEKKLDFTIRTVDLKLTSVSFFVKCK